MLRSWHNFIFKKPVLSSIERLQSMIQSPAELELFRDHLWVPRGKDTRTHSKPHATHTTHTSHDLYVEIVAFPIRFYFTRVKTRIFSFLFFI